MPYNLSETSPCCDLRYPFSQDSPYEFHYPFCEEHIFNSDSNVKIKYRSDAVIQTGRRSNIEIKPQRINNKSRQSSKTKLERETKQERTKSQKSTYRGPCPKQINLRRNKEIVVATARVNSFRTPLKTLSPKNSDFLPTDSITEQGSKDKIQNNLDRNQRKNLLNFKRHEEVISNTARLDLVRPIKTVHPDKSRQKVADGKQHFDWNNYHRLKVIHGFMDGLELDYPSICTTSSIGKSLEGRDLKILRISNSNAGNTGVWIDAGIHAREWIAPATATYLADSIARNFNTLPNFITNKDWYFLPVMNPDGYEYSHTKDRMWRKNKAWHRGQLVGVDLNRNFSYGWGRTGSSDDPISGYYRGPTAFSEPESCAVRDMLLHSGTKFSVYITLHSYGQVILFPFGCRSELCPSYVRLLEGATVMSRAIYDCNGNTYKVGISRDVMYGAAGTSNDWSYGVAGIPYCYLLELRSKQHRFKVPQCEIEETGTEILSSVYALMEFVDSYVPPKIRNPCLETDGDEVKEDFPLTTRECTWQKYFLALCLLNRFKVARSKSTTQVWEVTFIREGQRFFVKSLDTVGAINIWKEERSTMDIMVEGRRAAQIAGMLHEREISYSIAIPDVDQLITKEQSTSSIAKTFRKAGPASGIRKAMDWHNYHRLDTIYAFMDNLVMEFPYLCSVEVIGKSVEGRDLKLLKVSNGNPDNAGVWLDGAIHPREWISSAVVTYFADKLIRTFHEQPDTVTNKDWFILPVLNPDGYEYTHTQDRMWRKNRSQYGECVGVDLNRNFSYGWGEKGEEGSSEDPGNIFFRGSKPFSEPETAAVKRAISESGTTFKVFLSFHSYGEVIIFPWGYTGDPCPDYVELLEGGTAMAKAIHETSGHTYKVGSTKDLMYYASGTSTDWAYAVANIPYSYMVELRGKKHRFLLPKEEIISTAKEVSNGVMRLMDFVDKRCRSTQSCTCSK